MDWSRRTWSTRFVAASAVATFGRSAWAGSGTSRLTLDMDPQPVARNEVAYLQLKLTLSKQPSLLSQPQILAPAGVKVRQTQRSQSQVTKIINGKMSVELSLDYTFELSSPKAGVFAIGAKVNVDGQMVQAVAKKRLTVTQKANAPKVAKAGDPVMLIPSFAPETPLYVGQLGFFQLELWTRSSDVPSSAQRPMFEEFITEDFTPPRRRIVNFRGRNYNVQTIYYRAVFPQKSGELTIPGIELEMTPSGFGSLFGGRRRQRPYRISGPSTKVQVLELPQKGKPKNFPETHVGTFSLRSEIDRTDLTVGDALTLTVEVAGQGNLRLIDLGALPAIAGLRSYEPKRDEPEYQVQNRSVRGTVRWKYLLIASKAGTVTIPRLSLPYFDPEQKRYRVAQAAPITLDIKDANGAVPKTAAAQDDDGDAPAGGSLDVENEQDNEALDTAEQMEFAPMRPAPTLNDRQPLQEDWLTGGRYLGLCALAPAGVAVYAGQGWLANKLGQPERVRRRQERDELLQLIDRAQNSREPKEGWGSLGQLLQRLAIMRAGPGAKGAPRPELLTLMQKAGLSASEVQTWGTWLDACDASRFGAGHADPDALERGCSFAKEQIHALTRVKEGS